MAKLTLSDAEAIALRQRPWTIRLEFTGPNPANASGVSRKYWYATGRGQQEPVEVSWGALGQAPQHQLVNWTDLCTRVAEKLAKGYDWEATPHIRMSAVSLALIVGQVQATPYVAPPAPVAAPKPKPAPVVVKPAPQAPVVTQTPPAKVPVSLQTQAFPLNLVCSLRLARKGLQMLGYSALDSAGNVLLQFDAPTGLAFAQTHNLDILFV